MAIIAEGVPEQQTRELIKTAEAKEVGVIGPATVGGLKPKASPDPLDGEVMEVLKSNFRTLLIPMLTLVQFVCLDRITAISKPLVEELWWLRIPFFGAILIVGVVLMNPVTAVIVNGAPLSTSPAEP